MSDTPQQQTTGGADRAAPVAKAAPKAAPAADKAKPRQVRLFNRLPQSVSYSVDAGNGPESRQLGPRETSDPIDEDALTDHARRLVAKGHLAKRAADAGEPQQQASE